MNLLKTEEVATTLQVSKYRVYELARLNLIPHVRMGRQIRFDERLLNDWIAKGGSNQKNDSEESKSGGQER